MAIQMRIQNLSVIMILTAVGHFSLAAPQIDPSCGAKPVKDRHVEGRASRVTFPDGRVLTIVGHLDGSDQLFTPLDVARMNQIADSPDEGFTAFMALYKGTYETPYDGLLTKENRDRAAARMKAEYGFDISQLVKSDFPALPLGKMSIDQHAQEDYWFLTDQLNSNKGKERIEFVGTEAKHPALQRSFDQTKIGQKAFLEGNAKRRRNGKAFLSPVDARNLLMATATGNVYAYLENPSLSQQAPLLEIEEAEPDGQMTLMRKALEELTAADDAYWGQRPASELESFKKDNRNLRFSVLLAHVYSQVEGMSVNSSAELDSHVKALRNSAHTWVRDPLEKLIALFKERIALNTARIAETARNLAGRHQSGIHFTDLNNYQNMVRQLEWQCTNEAKSSGTSSGASGAKNKRQ